MVLFVIMGVLASRFTEITAKAGKPVKGNIEVSTSLPTLTSMKLVEIGSGKQKKDLLLIGFEYMIEYKQMGAKIELKGEVTYSAEDPKKLVNLWDKKNKVEEAMSLTVLNYLIKRCSIESVKIADDLQLPVPVRLPEIRSKEGK